MGDKFLPIGTVVNVKGINKKVLIIGFLGISYNGNLKLYDYKGIEYPEGTLCENKQHYFNHKDIENVIFRGYESDEHINFNNVLLKKQESKSKNKDLEFDSNGVVIFDGDSTEETVVEEKPLEVKNPFKTEVNDTPVTEVVKSNDWSIFKPFKFDANGRVISDEEFPTEVSVEDVNNKIAIDGDKFVVAEETSIETSIKEPKANNKIAIDGDKFVVTEETSTETSIKEPKANNKIAIDGDKFVVVGESPTLKFDASGRVIADEEVTGELPSIETPKKNDIGEKFNRN